MEDGTVVKKARSFLNEFIENFAHESLSFFEFWDEFPFTYRERQVNSVVIPSIHKITGNVWLEQPFKKNNDDQRFLDIATVKNGNIYAIELKHAWKSKTDYFAQHIDKEWATAIEQISDIKKRTLYDYKNYDVFKIALMVLPTYHYVNSKNNIDNMTAEEYNAYLKKEYFDNWTKKYAANYIGVIKITNPDKYVHEYSDGEQIFPFISFVARIERV